MSGTRGELHDENGGVFVMRCWVREDGEVAGRVRWSTVDGDNENTTLGSAAGLVREVRSFLRRVAGEKPEGHDGGP